MTDEQIAALRAAAERVGQTVQTGPGAFREIASRQKYYELTRSPAILALLDRLALAEAALEKRQGPMYQGDCQWCTYPLGNHKDGCAYQAWQRAKGE